MLETLDTVSWSKLGHAYGDASDVPDLLRALASSDKQVAEKALGKLWSNVTHQGTVYSSTAYVVPFFCELLEAPDIHQKDGLLYYLASIAHGASYVDVHVREPERRGAPEIQEQIAEELGWVQAAKNAVSDGYLTYMRLLDDPNPIIREGAAHTLLCCQSHAAQVIPIMKDHFIKEEDSFVRASLILSLGILLKKNEETALFFSHTLQQDVDPLLHVAAAISSAFCMGEQTSQEAIVVLLQSYELPQEVKQQFSKLSFADADLDACISSALRCIGLSIAPFVTPILIRNVRHSDAWSGLTFVDNLLFFALEGKKITHTMTVTDLSDLQRDALTAIYETDELWKLGNMSFLVGYFFDPKIKTSYNMSYWQREDVGAFLSGQKVFNY